VAVSGEARKLKSEAAETLPHVEGVVHGLAGHLNPGVGGELASSRCLCADHKLGVDSAAPEQEPEHERAAETTSPHDRPTGHETHGVSQRPGFTGVGGHRDPL
jgi:hypothetical protein